MRCRIGMMIMIKLLCLLDDIEKIRPHSGTKLGVYISMISDFGHLPL